MMRVVVSVSLGKCRARAVFSPVKGFARLLGFSRQEYWSGLPFPSPGDLPGSGIKLGSPALQKDSLPPAPPGKPSPMICWA